MEQSFLTICPLKENKVSGLINIIKSIQFQKYLHENFSAKKNVEKLVQKLKEKGFLDEVERRAKI